ncbi:uncharacterized protein LOC109856125 [Pseudomyrmex gracilis]|uniref:uncharacterized protein LOC109856125 n=1 Tax=Pseudomyrmex gracilis TaxID=219809 RepID=UPI0009959619|nr:uncharacterized protein LOC109856125 [Pseudomyrmex gracilis]
MKSDEIAIENISEVKTVILSSPRKGQVINAVSEGAQASGSSNSSDSSPSDLRRRLQDLPSPDEFDLVADRVAALGRRICRKRELFLRLQGVAGRIEEKDEWEERESTTGSGSSLTRLKDARARRRARARFSESSFDNKAMVISQAGKSSASEFSADRSTRDNDYLHLPAIEMSRRQYRSSSVSEPCSTRLSHQNRDEPNEIRINRYRNFTSRDHDESKSADLPSVSSFSISKIRPKKFGGYRPSSGVVVKNLSSESSESESAANETNPVRNIDDATLELSSPESKVVNGPVKKMPIMSARSDITESILPSLLPSARSYHDRPVFQDAPRNCAAERISDVRKKPSRDVLLFSARNFTSDSEELVTSARDEKMRIKDNVRRAISELEDKLRAYDEGLESCRIFAPRAHDNQDLNPSTNRSDLEGDYSENIDDDVRDDTEKRNQSKNTYAKKVENTPRLFEEKIKNDATEDALSQASDAIQSENRSQSSCAAKYLQKPTSSGRSKNGGADLHGRCDQEINRVINVPTLALDSQDISYSTSAGSRECSVTQSLDPRALIKALSTVSLKQEENVSRKLERFSRNDKIDTSDFSTKGETWRVPRSSSTELSAKSLSRAPSRIPVRISSSKLALSASGASKPSGFFKQPENSNAVASDEKAKFTDRNGIQKKRVVARQRSEVELLYCQTRERDSSLESNANENVEASDEEMEYEANGYKPRGFSTVSNRRSVTYDDCVTYEKTQRSSETEFGADSKTSCPPVFFTKPTYSDNRHQDCAKIDARSNRSTSRESAITANVTSATESPCLSRYKKNESRYVESSRNIEENFTWRTEDECASIRDEENPENVEYEVHARESCDESTEEPHSTKRDRFEVSMKGLSNLHQSGIEKVAKRQRIGDDLREFNENRSNRDPSTSESTKVAQSEDLASQVHKTQEICSLIANMSSSSLNYEQKRRKKSQERFPFTISEASGMFSTERKNMCDCRESLDKKNRPADARHEEKTAHRLTTHPSITRLAVSGLPETMGEILSCAMRQEKETTSSKSKLRAIMRIFSSKSKKKTKQSNNSKSLLEATEIIYKNRACQADSRANSCSGDSITHGTNSMNDDEPGNNRRIDCNVTRYQITRSNPALVSSGNALRKTESLEAIDREHPRRRYDRDDLWVRDPSSEEKINETRENDKNNTRESSDDRYSIFFAKNLESDRLSESNNSPKDERDVITSGRALLSDKKSKQIPSNCVSDEEDEDVTGCFCLKLCRLFASSSKNRSSVKEQIPLSSRAENSVSLLLKRKK